MRIKSLSVKMQIALDIVFICIMLPLSLLIYQTLKVDTERKSITELSNITEMVRSSIELNVQSAVENHLRSIANKTKDLFAYEYARYKKGEISEEEAYENSRKILLNPDYGKIGTSGYLAGIDYKGVLEIHPKSQGVDASGFEFMQKAIAMKEGYLEYMWKNTGEETERKKAGYLSPFTPWNLIIWASSYSSEFLYLIDTDLIISAVKKLKIGSGGYAIVLDSKGKIIYHPESVEENLFIDTNGNPANTQLQQLLENTEIGQEKTGYYPGESRGEERLVSIANVESMGWYVLTSISTDEILKTVRTIRRILILGFLVTFFLINFVIFILFRHILKPLKEISIIATAVSRGDITQKAEVLRQDETGVIAEQVNIMTDNMRQIVQRLKSDVMTLNDSIQEMSSSSAEISTTSNEQASAVKEIVSTMEDSDRLSKGIEKKVAEVSQIADHSKSIVNKGVDHVEQSLVKMDEIRISNHDTISGIRSLSEKIEAIWEIVTIINSIADQTKIIAFNAELEASAAGDAGKNFQIVASEIRRLANSTVNSTSEIKNKINEIQYSSDRLITASEDGTNKIDEGGKLTEILHQTFEEILQTSEISADSAKDISTSIRQQVLAFEQILLTLKQISAGINNFVISTKSTADITQRLKTMSDNIAEFLSGYKTDLEEDEDEDEDDFI
ncbi:methyl-accepting chemotaxis protein [Oceanispirochaeta sp.]|jgi:methyl-accepting chemotaxis protein|uniref:methyl-accepting chemotaxis protein n=1 Tax=Oceanispirochaeta sp. TaxID=2035350 RepID=UPI00262ED1B3|nr:methyl-accepting chemotaxis protein [Oceanispirochaeta sp.]MDA3958947.1 methyl-accepting chemotaxis protein [Oceanispirochaeta sp.]